LSTVPPIPRAYGIIEWLSGDECHELDPSGLITGFGIRLREAGMPVDRLALHLRTLNPMIRGRTIAWAPDEPVEFRDHQHGAYMSARLNSPFHHVATTQEWLSLRLDGRYTTKWSTTKWSMPDVFRNRDLVELLIAPLRTANSPASAASFGTRRSSGFSASHHALLRALVPALRSALELKLLRAVETTLLATYVGTIPGQRIRAGQIRRGDAETLEAALMVCDLRGFTVLSNRLPEDQILKLLNLYFDQVVPAITDCGGEILKFMGDAVLAYFHHRDGAAASCVAAFEAARTALARLATTASDDGCDLHAGIALHYGRVSYGNIGSGKRLDFTVIGRDINLVSRIQGICAVTGQPLLMSGQFADLLAAPPTVSIGRHELKGFDSPLSCSRRQSARIGH
jgi:adenylate cyclase